MNPAEFETFLRGLSAADMHIQSYNHFILHDLPLMVQNLFVRGGSSAPDTHSELEFFAVHCPRACALRNGVYRPTTPLTCRREKSCYMAPVFASVRHAGAITQRVVVAHVPVMLGSCLCQTTASKETRDLESLTDDGGYFIINGVERVLVTQRRKCYNFPQVVRESSGTLTVNMRSISRETNHSVLIELSMRSGDDNDIVCSLPYVGKKIPIHVLIAAFGAWDEFRAEFELADRPAALDEDSALEYIGSFATKKAAPAAAAEDETAAESDEEQWESESTRSSTSIMSEAKETLRRGRVSYARQIVEVEMFPHLGRNASKEAKYRTLCAMVRRLLMAARGEISADNRENLIFHRFETSGILLGEMYGMLFRNFLNTYKETGKSVNVVTDFTNKLEAFVTKNIKSCLSTGKWGIQKGSYVRQGVSQVLARLSVLGTRSHLQRVMLPVGKEGKNVKLRLIHPSHFGYICLFETPEGAGCGIVLNFTCAARVSREYQAPYIRDIVAPLCASPTDESIGMVEVWIDNTFVARTARPLEFAAQLKELRARGVLPADVSVYIARDKRRVPYEIRIFAEKGRILRPLLDPKGRVVYVDPAEIQDSYVYAGALVLPTTPSLAGYDYQEIHPVLMLSICAASIPFLDHIQSPRIVYESSMLKQAIGSLTIVSPAVWEATLGNPKGSALFPYTSPALFSMTIGFVGIWLFSLLDGSQRARADKAGFLAQQVRSETGIGAAGASGH